MRNSFNTFDPRDIPALWDGAIYIPGKNVELIENTNNSKWKSLAQEVNDCTDSHTGHKPVLSSLPNGQKYWNLAAGGPYSSWLVESPSSAYQWIDVGAYAMWVYLETNDLNPHVACSQWPEALTPKNRIYVQKNIDADRMAIYGSRNGYSNDNALGQNGKGDRWKWNSSWSPGIPPLINWQGWHFIVLLFDMSQNNYYGPEETPNNLLCSNKLQVFVDGIYCEGMFSAPQPNYGGAPPTGPITNLFASNYPFSWGAQYASNHFDGIGACYVARGHVPFSAWNDIMNYWRP